jgi:hypothetical protein
MKARKTRAIAIAFKPAIEAPLPLCRQGLPATP